MNIQETTRDTLNQQAYKQLLSLMLSGELSPGTQLDERVLSNDMGISRTPIRGAIAQLVREGLVEYFPYRGNFVRTWSKKEIEDLFRVRIALEVLAIRLAIPKLSNEDIDHIRTILKSVESALAEGDLEAFGEADRKFHTFISRKTDNQTLIEMLERMAIQIQMIRTFANQDPDVVTRTRRERPLILAALEARDADQAAQLMEQHINGVREAVLARLTPQPAVESR